MIPNREALYGYLLDDLYGLGVRRFPSGDYFPGASVDDVFRMSLARSFYKKLVDATSPSADEACFNKFWESNLRCESWKLVTNFAWEDELVGEFKTLIDRFFYPNSEPLVSSIMDLAIRGRLGPGASIGANGTDFYTKLFSSELSSTSPEIYRWYIEYIQWFTDWGLGEVSRLMSFGLPVYTQSNSLSFVRKTRDISRSICTEPTLNMFFQLGLGEIIGERLRSYFGIDLSTQPERNRKLACRGSLDDSLVTIDLESASDSMSLGMCETFLPDFLLDLLHRFRCTHSKINGKELRLHMISTMGNGFTFPLQTCVFACVVGAAARLAGDHLTRADDPSPNWGVFGDDIICPSGKSARYVVRLLDILGFRVNSSKSYFVGPFRESCGLDAFNGVNVRGVYLKTLQTQEARFVAINLLNDWTARSGIPLPRTIGYLRDSVRDLAVPPHASPDSGIRTPSPPPGLWSSSKQRYVYRCREVSTSFLTVDDKDRILLPSSCYKRVRRRVTSPNGLYYSFLGGYIRNSKIPLSLRQGEEPSYRTVTRVSPFWGPSLQQRRDAPFSDFWQRWNTAACSDTE